LYERQCDYFEKLSNGYNFKLERELQKQKKKEENKKLQGNKIKVKEEKVKEEEIVIRKDDPVVSASELIGKNWENNKYTNMNNYHL
jgi:hypothetical protein